MRPSVSLPNGLSDAGCTRGSGILISTILIAGALLVLPGSSSPARADVNLNGDCWQDTTTGKFVRRIPSDATPDGRFKAVHGGNVIPLTNGHEAEAQPDGSWIDTTTGQQLPTVPSGATSDGRFEARHGRNVVGLENGHEAQRVPCPPPSTTGVRSDGQVGFYLGGELIKTWGRVKSTETSAATGAVTNQFSDSGDPLGGGIVGGYNFVPWTNWVIGPFASFDWLRLTINHTFPGGTYLGTTTNWIANLGAKAGYMVAPGWQVYGLAGAAWLNESLNINFPAGFSTKTTTTPGFTLGLGTEYHPSTWQVAGH